MSVCVRARARARVCVEVKLSLPTPSRRIVCAEVYLYSFLNFASERSSPRPDHLTPRKEPRYH